MKKIIGIAAISLFAASMMFGQSALKNLSGAINSAKKAAESAKQVADSTKKVSKKKVSKQEEKETVENDMVPLSSLDGFYIYMNLSDTKVTDDWYLDYAKTVEKDIYEKYQNDEFEWQDKFADIKKKFDAGIESANVDGTFVISSTFEFGDYDFSKEAYKVDVSKDLFFPLKSVCDATYRYASTSRDSIFDKKLALKIKDAEKFTLLKMPKDEAKQFLQSRKDSYGNVNRKIAILYKYEIESFNSKEYESWAKLASSNGYLPLMGLIKEIQVFDTTNNQYKLLGTLVE